jgi:hypothetical protein
MVPVPGDLTVILSFDSAFGINEKQGGINSELTFIP